MIQRCCSTSATQACDYASDKVVLSDIEDWTPDGSGQFKPVHLFRRGEWVWNREKISPRHYCTLTDQITVELNLR